MRRQVRSAIAFALLQAAALALGSCGYHWIAELDWIDALLNAAMIFTGMGPVNVLPSSGAKLFANGYALFSGIAFVISAGILVTPLLHRLVHKFHLEEGESQPRRH